MLPTVEPWKIFVNCRKGYPTIHQLTIQYAYASEPMEPPAFHTKALLIM